MKALYYWLDLCSPDGKPSHSKVLAALAEIVLLAALVIATIRMDAISPSFVGLALVAGALPFGLNGYKTLTTKMRSGDITPVA